MTRIEDPVAWFEEQLLPDVDLGRLRQEDRCCLLARCSARITARVDARIKQGLRDNQVQAFESLLDARDLPAAFRWLDANCPWYPDAVREERARLSEEACRERDEILAGYGTIDAERS